MFSPVFMTTKTSNTVMERDHAACLHAHIDDTKDGVISLFQQHYIRAKKIVLITKQFLAFFFVVLRKPSYSVFNVDGVNIQLML